MRIASLAVAGSVAACALAGCGSTGMSGSTASTSLVSVERGVRFVHAALAEDDAGPVNPGGPHVRVSGTVVSGGGGVVDAGAVKAYVLDGPPGRAKHVIATIGVHGGTFATSFTVIGPGGNVLRLDYVVDSRVFASTVIKELNRRSEGRPQGAAQPNAGRSNSSPALWRPPAIARISAARTHGGK